MVFSFLVLVEDVASFKCWLVADIEQVVGCMHRAGWAAIQGNKATRQQGTKAATLSLMTSFELRDFNLTFAQPCQGLHYRHQAIVLQSKQHVFHGRFFTSQAQK